MTLRLDPDVEKGLMARAHERGVSLDDYLQEVVAREVGLPARTIPYVNRPGFDNLSETDMRNSRSNS
jgi:hypothetical protein